jgi:Protein of unknown function (DUF2800)
MRDVVASVAGRVGRADTVFLDADKQGSAHARLSASGSSIWLNCESAPALALTCPPRAVGEAARIGTIAHWLGEQCLRDPNFLAPAHVMMGGVVYDVTIELMLAVSVYVTYVENIIKQTLVYGIEAHVDLAPLWAPGQPPEPVFGTADFWAIVGDCLIVVDYKNGRGKFVSPVENPQATFYALGVYLALGPLARRQVRRVRIVIVQPNSEGEHIRGWGIPAGDLIFWGYAVLKPAADRIFEGRPGPYAVGSWCWFCPGALMCPAKAEARQLEALSDFPVWNEQEMELI